MQNNIAMGYIRGTGAAVNVSIGFIPDLVMVINATDGDIVNIAAPGGGRQVMPFSSGGLNGTTQPNPFVAGDYIKGLTSLARAQVAGVILDAGSWAAGDASGWLILDLATKTGTFQGENIVHVDSRGNLLNAETDNATVTVDLVPNQSIVLATATVSGNAAITAYAGTVALQAGFTLGSTVSEDAKLLLYVAFRAQGAYAIANSL